jgi:hypothetical protein
VKSPNSNEVADFKAISARNKMSIAFFGLNCILKIETGNYSGIDRFDLFSPKLKA